MSTLDRALARRLLAAAREATGTAYVPYSNFPVGAALLTADGTMFTGGNIENASYGLTVCAERTAIFHAVHAGHRAVPVIAVAATRIEGVTPCGACRQVLNEFVPAGGEMIVILDRSGEPELTTLSALLPRSFGPRDLA